MGKHKRLHSIQVSVRPHIIEQQRTTNDATGTQTKKQQCLCPSRQQQSKLKFPLRWQKHLRSCQYEQRRLEQGRQYGRQCEQQAGAQTDQNDLYHEVSILLFSFPAGAKQGEQPGAVTKLSKNWAASQLEHYYVADRAGRAVVAPSRSETHSRALFEHSD